MSERAFGREEDEYGGKPQEKARGPLDDVLARELLKYAVQRQIFSPYGGDLLDMRRAVLIDGTDHGGRMNIMTAADYDKVLASLTAQGLSLEGAFGHEVDVYDGRKLFAPKKAAEMNGQELIAQAFDGVEEAEF